MQRSEVPRTPGHQKAWPERNKAFVQNTCAFCVHYRTLVDTVPLLTRRLARKLRRVAFARHVRLNEAKACTALCRRLEAIRTSDQ